MNGERHEQEAAMFIFQVVIGAWHELGYLNGTWCLLVKYTLFLIRFLIAIATNGIVCTVHAWKLWGLLRLRTCFLAPVTGICMSLLFTNLFGPMLFSGHDAKLAGCNWDMPLMWYHLQQHHQFQILLNILQAAVGPFMISLNPSIY